MIRVAHPGTMRTVAQDRGDDAEAAVARSLLEAGWSVLGRNVRAGRGELDIVAIDPGPPASLVVVEVRWRQSRDFGLAEETLDRRKRLHLRAAIGRLLDDRALLGPTLRSLPVRVDLVVVEPRGRVRHHRAIEL